MEACRNRDMGVIDLLLKYSARDDDCKALAIGQAHHMLSQILTLRIFLRNFLGFVFLQDRSFLLISKMLI